VKSSGISGLIQALLKPGCGLSSTKSSASGDMNLARRFPAIPCCTLPSASANMVAVSIVVSTSPPLTLNPKPLS